MCLVVMNGLHVFVLSNPSIDGHESILIERLYLVIHLSNLVKEMDLSKRGLHSTDRIGRKGLDPAVCIRQDRSM